MKHRSLGLVVVLCACSGQSLDVGDDPSSSNSLNAAGGTDGGGTGGGGAGGGGTGVAPVNPFPSQAGCSTDPELAALVGTWEGYLEDFYLNPVKAIRIDIQGASAERFCGSVTWGTRDAPPPAADPDGVYPSSDYWAAFGIGGGSGLPPIDGFPYTITNGGGRVPTLRLGIASGEPWQSWCEIQTPVFENGAWQCSEQFEPYWPGGSAEYDPYADCTVTNSHGSFTYSAFKCSVCSNFITLPLCTCNDVSCVALPAQPMTFALELSENGQVLSGPFSDTEYSYPSDSATDWLSGHAFRLERVLTED